MNFIQIPDRKQYLIDVPHIHPASLRYKQEWAAIKKKMIEGIWGYDYHNTFRFCPPTLAWLINFTVVHNLSKKAKNRKASKPILVDSLWELAYASIEARGFSGFKDDTQCTSDYAIKEISKSRTPTSDIDTSLYLTPEGKFKEFRSPREALRMRHTKPLGCPLYNNEAQNLAIMGARGSFKSYYVALGEFLHEFVFNGAKEYTEDTIKNPAKIEMFVGAAVKKNSEETCDKIEEAMRELATNQELGAWGKPGDKDYAPSPFYKRTSGTLNANNLSSPWRDEFLVKTGNRELSYGTKSYIAHGIITARNPQVMAGGRYSKVHVEEHGLCDNLTTAHFSAEACTIISGNKYGTIYYTGTAGNIEKIHEAQKMFTHPKEYGLLAYKNDWEDNPGQSIGFFLPAYYTDLRFKDENGNTNIDAAKAEYLGRRVKAQSSSDSSAIEGEMMNYPLYPSEMFMSKTGNYFPVIEVKQRLEELERDKRYERIAQPIELFFDSTQPTGVNYKLDMEKKLTPLDTYPLQTSITSREGCTIMFEMPIYENGTIPPDFYIAGHDPVGSDSEWGESLAATYIMKSNKHLKHGHSQIVAVDIGRPYLGRDIYNERLEKLCMFYGLSPRALAFENKVGNVKEYFQRRQKLWLLATAPETIMTAKERNSSSAVIYGFPMDNKEHKLEALKYTRQWLLRERGPNEKGQIIRNIDLIPDRALLQEMLVFRLDEGNYDRVMAFMQCILLMEEKYNKYEQSFREPYYKQVNKYFAEALSSTTNKLHGIFNN